MNKRNRKRDGIRNTKQIIQAVLDGNYHKAAILFPYISNNLNKTEIMEIFFQQLSQAITNQEQFLVEINHE